MRSLSQAEYEELATFRHQIRRFLHFSEQAALAEGIEPHQHQALLAIKAIEGGHGCSIRTLAERLFLRHQSAVGLIDRMELGGFVRRMQSLDDGRQVIVTLTPKGEDLLRRLSLMHATELGQRAPELVKALRAIMRRSNRK